MKFKIGDEVIDHYGRDCSAVVHCYPHDDDDEVFGGLAIKVIGIRIAGFKYGTSMEYHMRIESDLSKVINSFKFWRDLNEIHL